MRTNLIAIAATLLAITAFAVPVGPVAGEVQDGSIDLTFEASATIDQADSVASELDSVATPKSKKQDKPQDGKVWGQDPPPIQWGAPSSSLGGWGEEESKSASKGWGAPPRTSATQAGSWGGARPSSTPNWGSDSSSSSQPSIWGQGASFGAPPPADHKPSQPSSSQPSIWGQGASFGAPPPADHKPSQPSSSGGIIWGTPGNPRPNPSPVPKSSSGIDPAGWGVFGNPFSNSPPASQPSWGAAPPSSGSSWGAPQAQPTPLNIGPSSWGSRSPSSSGPSWGAPPKGGQGQRGSRPSPTWPSEARESQASPPQPTVTVVWPAPKDDGWREIGQRN
jgi:hypothetical protein